MVQNICILLLCSHGLHLVCPEHPRSQQISHRVCKIQVITCEDVKFGKIEVSHLRQVEEDSNYCCYSDWVSCPNISDDPTGAWNMG